MSSRNLLAELEQKRSAVVAATGSEEKVLLQATSKVKAAKTEATAVAKPTAEVEEEAAKVLHCELDTVISIAASDQGQTNVVDTGCEEAVKGLQGMNGSAFFDTGIKFHGSPLWKSTENRDVISGPLYWFHMPIKGTDIKGWYCSNHLFGTEKEKNKLEADGGLITAAWASGDQEVPRSIHCPYWSKKPEKGIVCTSLWESYLQLAEKALAERADNATAQEALAERLAKVEGERDHLAACLDKVIKDETLTIEDREAAKQIVGDVQMDGHEDYKGKGQGTYDDEDDDDAYDDDGQHKGSWGKKGAGKKGKKRQHGGWMPKLAQVCAAYWNSDWDYCGRLVSRFHSESRTLAMLIDQKLKKD